MNFEEMFVRNARKNKILFFSDHCYERMATRHIKNSEVYDCIEKGNYVETQTGYTDQGEAPRLIFYSGNERNFYVVVAVEFPDYCRVVTVCQPDPKKWEICGDTIKRRK